MSEARTAVKVISQEGPAVQVSLEQPTYTFGEGDGEVLVGLEARTVPGVPCAPDFTVTIVSKPMEASSPGPNGAPPGDYVPLSNIVEFHSNDFREEDGVLVGHVEVPVTILEDEVYEGNERFGLELARSVSLTPEESGAYRITMGAGVPAITTINSDVAVDDAGLNRWG